MLYYSFDILIFRGNIDVLCNCQSAVIASPVIGKHNIVAAVDGSSCSCRHIESFLTNTCDTAMESDIREARAGVEHNIADRCCPSSDHSFSQ